MSHCLMKKSKGLLYELLERRQMLAAHIVGSSTSYSTIQAAVNAAAAGAIISVDPGTYTELVTINKRLTIRGAEAGVDARGGVRAANKSESTITGASGSGGVSESFYVAANDVTIDGFTVQGTTNQSVSTGAGIVIAPNIAGTHILNNIVQNNTSGLFLANNSSTDPAVIQHNIFQSNNNASSDGGRGIYTDQYISGGNLTNVVIDANTFTNNHGSTGTTTQEAACSFEATALGDQSNIRITNNLFQSNGKATLFFDTNNVLIQGNTITSQTDSAGTLRFEGGDTNVTIKNNNCYNNGGTAVAIDSKAVGSGNSGFAVNQNDFTNNSVDWGDKLSVIVQAATFSGTLDATSNWWGSASGPGGQGSGTGDKIYGDGHWVSGNQWYEAVGSDVTFSNWSTTAFTWPTPSAPATLSASATVSGSSATVALSWPTVAAAYTYSIERSTDGNSFSTIAVASAGTTSVSDASAVTGTTYYYRISAENLAGASTYTTTGAISPGGASPPTPTAPSAPLNLAATAVSSSAISLTWAASSNATSYAIDRSTDGTNFTTIATGISASAISYADNGPLAASTKYYYRIRAVNAVGSSVNSSIASASTLATTPVTPPVTPPVAPTGTGTYISDLTWSSATIGWGTIQKDKSVGGNTLSLDGTTYAKGIGTHAISNIVYNLAGQYTTFTADVGVDDENSGGTGSVDFQVIGDGKILFDSGILHNGNKPAHINISVAGVLQLTLFANDGVAGTNANDHADWAGAELFSSTPIVPSAPTNLAAAAASSSAISLTWAAGSSNVSGYSIDRSTDGTNFTTIATSISASATSYTDTGPLAASTKYYYRIRAVNSVGSSGNSIVASATTNAATASTVTYISDLTATRSTIGWGTIQKDKSVLGNPLTLKGVTYAKGIGTHAVSNITYNLAGKFSTFVSDVGVDQEEDTDGPGSIDFQVIGDGKVLFDSGVLTNDQVAHINVSVTGVQTLTLVATNGIANNINHDHADWAGAELLA